MLTLTLPQRALSILCLGAHPDDIEIGCGGSILRLLAERPGSAVDWLVLSGTPERAREARRGASVFLAGAGRSRISVKRFRDGFFPGQFSEVKDELERLKKRVAPDVVFCPHRNDAHQDHRLVSELAWNTFRDHLILEYEIPKYDGDLGSPSVFLPLERPVCGRKIELLRKVFVSQSKRRWFGEDTFWALLRLRGMESNSESSYAEAFYCRKLVI